MRGVRARMAWGAAIVVSIALGSTGCGKVAATLGKSIGSVGRATTKVAPRVGKEAVQTAIDQALRTPSRDDRKKR